MMIGVGETLCRIGVGETFCRIGVGVTLSTGGRVAVGVGFGCEQFAAASRCEP